MKIQEKLELISNANNFLVKETGENTYSIYYMDLVAVIRFDNNGWKETKYYINAELEIEGNNLIILDFDKIKELKKFVNFLKDGTTFSDNKREWAD